MAGTRSAAGHRSELTSRPPDSPRLGTGDEFALLFVPWLYPWVTDLVDCMQNPGHDTIALTHGTFGNYPHTEADSRWRVIGGRWIGRMFLPALWRLARILKQRPEFAITFGSETLTAGIIWMWSKVVARRCVVVIEENQRPIGGPLFSLGRSAKEILLHMIFVHADVLIAESEESVRYLRNLGVDRETIVRPHGVNTRRFRPLPREAARELGLKDSTGRTVVLFVGEFCRHKGSDVLIETVRLMSGEQSILFLLPEDSRRSEVVREAVALGTVVLYPPILPEKMPLLYAAADLVVVPSLKNPSGSSDRSPNVLMEAMACGKPVVATTVGGIPTILGARGILVQPGSAHELRDAILSLASKPEMLEAAGKDNRLRASQSLDIQAFAVLLLERVRSG